MSTSPIDLRAPTGLARVTGRARLVTGRTSCPPRTPFIVITWTGRFARECEGCWT